MSEAYANAQLSARADTLAQTRAEWAQALAPTGRTARAVRRSGFFARLLALFA